MAFEDKKKKAIALMEDKKMWRSNYAPPILRLFWTMGGKMPPPPFAPFWLNTLFFAVWFGPLWGIVMWFSRWKNQDCQRIAYGVHRPFCRFAVWFIYGLNPLLAQAGQQTA